MIWAERGQRLEIMVRKNHLSLSGEEDLINPLQHGMLALIAPSKQFLVQVGFLKSRWVEEVTELTHQSVIKLIVVLVLRAIDHIKVSSQWTSSFLN
jgi:hypothetical protein